MNRSSLWLAVIFSSLLMGCAATDFTTTYDSLSRRVYDSSENPADEPSAKDPDRITEIFFATEAQMLSASYEAIRYRFPKEEVHRLRAPEKGYAWSYGPQGVDVKFTVSRCSGDGGSKKRVTGWLYTIQSRSDLPQSEKPVSSLASTMNKALAFHKIAAFLVTGVTCGAGADESAAEEIKGKASGTGFLVSSDGYIITNNHVIADASHIDVLVAGGKSYVAQIVTKDPNNDVALLKIDAKATVPLPLGQTTAVRKGANVFTLGYPLPDFEGNELKATFGKVNALSGIHGDIRFLQIDVPIQPGNSGGPLIADDGSVIGITSGSVNDLSVIVAHGVVPQDVNYAVKSEYIMPLLQYAHVQPGGGKLTTGAIKNPSQFERSIVHILVEIGGESTQTEK